MAANVKTYKQWTLHEQKGLESLTYGETTFPKTEEIGDYDVLVKLYAASLNYRDLAITKVSSKLFPFLSYLLEIVKYH